VVVHRREYPAGGLLGRGVSDQFRAPDGERSGTVSVTVPREESEAGTWFYEAYVRPAAAREVDAYLCESRPLQWARATRSEVTSGERVTDARPAVDGTQFSRHLEGNDYVLSYRWQDSTGALWKADYRLRRSTHEAAVAVERGYTTTYEESLSNPVTRDFAATLAENAERISDDARDDTAASGGPATLGSLDAGKRFDALVQFVQGMRYARDAESLDTYDYHRTNEETLVAGGGDCKDLTYLLAGLLEASFDCGTALLFQAGHLILGVDADGVPSLPYAVDTTKVGGREFLVLDPSLTGPIDFYPDDPFVAAYADGEWFHADASAAGAGIDDVVRDYVQKTDVTPQVF
jgi:transglutaminase-like putative cysteine protease